MSNYYVYWTDPDDPDQGTNTGFEMFVIGSTDHENKDYATRFINEKIKESPNTLFTVISGIKMILQKEEVVTRYKIV